MNASSSSSSSSAAAAAPPPLRVLQLDALRLDAELTKLIFPGWSHVLHFFFSGRRTGSEGGGTSGSTIISEEFSQWLLHAAITAMTVLAGQPQPGAAMLGIKYKEKMIRKSSVLQSYPAAEAWRKRLTYFVVGVVLPGLFKFVIVKKLRARSTMLEGQYSELSRRSEELLTQSSEATLASASASTLQIHNADDKSDEDEQEHANRRDNDNDNDTAANRMTALRAVSRQKLAVALLLGADVVVEAVTKFAEIVNCLMFIGSSNTDASTAGYRSLTDRISGMTMEYEGDLNNGSSNYNDGTSR